MALPKGISDVLPLSSAQQGMLFHILESETTRARYVAVVSLPIGGALDPARLQAALQDTIDAHDALRASFIVENGPSPLQAIRTDVTVPFELLDLSGQPDAQGALDHLKEAERLRQFDLASAPLLVAKLVRLEPNSYVLVLTVQHLISDGWSLGVLLDEVFARYHGKIPPKAAQFRTYLTWMKNQPTEDADRFWQDHLAGCTPSLLNVPAEAAPKGEAVLQAQVPARVVQQIDGIAKRLRMTQNALLSSVWALTLRAITRSDDVVFGMTSAGRPTQIPGIANAIGAFVNTLPMRQIIDPAQTVDAFLSDANNVYQQRNAHDLLPLSHVQSLGGIGAGTTLFDTLFVHQGLPATQTNYEAFDLGVPSIRQSSNFAITMLARPAQELGLELIYDEARVAGYVAQSILELYQDILAAVAADTHRPIAQLLSKPQAPQPAPPFDCVLERFIGHGERTPDATALSDGETTLTYGDVLSRARHLAGALVEAGVDADTLVPVALPRGSDCVVAYLAVMMSGAAYVPIDLDYPQERIKQVLSRIAPAVVVAAAGTDLPTSAQIIDPKTSGDPIDPRAGALAYVIFTSGSQGVPKGVEITRQGLAYSTGIRGDVYDDPPDTFLLLSSLAFDSSVVGLFWTLATGGHLVLAPSRIEQDPTALGALTATHHVTHTLCLPGLYQALLKTVDPADLGTLTTVILAGEALGPDLVAKHAAVLPKTRLFNEYGPTEGTVWCAAYDATTHTGGPVPIGRAPTGTSLAPCDLDGNALPVGLSGELRLWGGGVARGYYGNRDQTAERFVDGGFCTGDLGYLREDGEIVFLGRQDNQIKIRGHRVELGEIEAEAHTFDAGPNYAAVSSDVQGSQQITLFVDAAVDTDRLRAQLLQRLPPHAVPTRITCVPELPRLPNGKIDVSTLRHLTRTAPSATDTAPQNELETDLAKIWSEVLGTQDIQRHANFFEIGGDSLKTIAVFALAEKRGLKLQPMDMFDHQTIAELAAHLAARQDQDVDHQNTDRLFVANAQGEGPLVCLLHANMGMFRNLANGLGPGFPVALLFSHHFQGVAPPSPNASIQDLAAAALERLKSVRNTGPYVLCGYSAGAVIALEMATQLRAGGDEVLLLSLIDPPYREGKSLRGSVRASLKAGFQIVRPLLKSSAEDLRRRKVDTAYANAIAAYDLPRFDGESLVLLTPENLAMEKTSPLAGVLPDATVNRLVCDHNDLLKKPAQTVLVVSRILAKMRR